MFLRVGQPYVVVLDKSSDVDFDCAVNKPSMQAMVAGFKGFRPTLPRPAKLLQQPWVPLPSKGTGN